MSPIRVRSGSTGKRPTISNPVDSRNLGIEMLYQNFALAGNINIYQNIFLGRELTKNYLGGMFKILDKKNDVRAFP